MKKINTLYLIVTISLISVFGYSQNNTIYYMGNVPQSYYLNPATQPTCGIFIGFPAASVYTNYVNSGFSPSDFFWYDSELDSVLTPLHPNAGIGDFLDKLNNVENFSLQQDLSFLSFGFRAGEMYFCFDATVHLSGRLVYPKSFMKFILSGNENNETFDFTDLNAEALAYTEFAVNVSRTFNDNMLSVGIRPKLLYGLGTYSTLNNNTTLSTSYEQWVLSTDFESRIALTGVELPLDEDGNLELDELKLDSIYSSGSAIKEAFGKNKGFAVDMGVHFRPVDQIQFSLSVLDLGFINWKANTHVTSYDGSYAFKGVRWDLNDTNDWEENMLDTIRINLNQVKSNDKFKTSLHTKIYAGGRIFLTPGFDVGLMSRTEFFPEYVDQDFILSANLHPVKAFSLSASYSLLGKGHTSLGLGLGLKIGPLNTYYVFDNIPLVYDKLKSTDPRMTVPVPTNLYKFGFRFGVNLTLGCNRYKKLSQDKPLMNSTNWIL